MITKTKRLENSTPIFSGNPRDDVYDWLFMVKQGFISANIEEKMKLNAIVNFVSDLPLLILKKHIESQSNWISFENELKSTFRNINRDQKIRSELISLKNREGLSIENYVSKFLTLTNKISFMAEDEKMFHFTQGLKESTKRELVCRNITILNSAIPLAIQLESFTKSVAKINYFRNNKSKNNVLFKKQYLDLFDLWIYSLKTHNRFHDMI
ncbi:9-cis-epoxycarotenoid dioxygenase chloroplastic-like [Brachionus plicatilis]|uniref:9-cis-epoxycarotenoid dioxygenase chloroplastic-like n=1 Tax=Brachionus plicatilis TaxID=10195 RepID=A0A3M7PC19_BRAPC|nr:9-cis-epoxycarotenoid dioxygenase chloroplastic-like [Brachionus plicatilis]